MKCEFCGQSISPTQNRCIACGRSCDATHGDYTTRFKRKDITKHRVLSVFSYLGFLVLIPLVFGRRSPYTRFHANQGLILSIIFTAYTLVTRIFVTFLDILFGGTYSAIPSTLSTISNFGSLFFMILLILGLSNASKGRAKELPLIGRIRFLT